MYSENFFASPLVVFTCPNIHNQKYIYFQEAFMTITEITKKYEKRVNLTEEKIQEIFNNVQTLLDTIPEKEINAGLALIDVTQTTITFSNYNGVEIAPDKRITEISLFGKHPFIFLCEVDLVNKTFRISMDDDSMGFCNWFERFSKHAELFEGSISFDYNCFSVPLKYLTH